MKLTCPFFASTFRRPVSTGYVVRQRTLESGKRRWMRPSWPLPMRWQALTPATKTFPMYRDHRYKPTARRWQTLCHHAGACLRLNPRQLLARVVMRHKGIVDTKCFFHCGAIHRRFYCRELWWRGVANRRTHLKVGALCCLLPSSPTALELVSVLLVRYRPTRYELCSVMTNFLKRAARKIEWKHPSPRWRNRPMGMMFPAVVRIWPACVCFCPPQIIGVATLASDLKHGNDAAQKGLLNVWPTVRVLKSIEMVFPFWPDLLRVVLMCMCAFLVCATFLLVGWNHLAEARHMLWRQSCQTLKQDKKDAYAYPLAEHEFAVFTSSMGMCLGRVFVFKVVKPKFLFQIVRHVWEMHNLFLRIRMCKNSLRVLCNTQILTSWIHHLLQTENWEIRERWIETLGRVLLRYEWNYVCMCAFVSVAVAISAFPLFNRFYVYFRAGQMPDMGCHQRRMRSNSSILVTKWLD